MASSSNYSIRGMKSQWGVCSGIRKWKWGKVKGGLFGKITESFPQLVENIRGSKKLKKIKKSTCIFVKNVLH